jgi:hypothetical protein
MWFSAEGVVAQYLIRVLWLSAANVVSHFWDVMWNVARSVLWPRGMKILYRTGSAPS